MKFRFFIRPALTVVFGFVGAVLAKLATPREIFAVAGDYFLIVAALAFGVLGFILPELIELLGKAGIRALAEQIVKYIPDYGKKGGRINVPHLPFGRKRLNKGVFGGKYLNPLIIDTSVLIDGRFADVVGTGFVFGTIMVIPSVVSELQRLADSADELKRARGRRGLDVLSELKKNKKVKMAILSSEPKEGAVDDKLLVMARKIGGRVLTIDFNLSKVAHVRGVEILNLNELVNALKTVVLPGEGLKIRVDSVGRGEGQGIGHLDDGTMVVVEDGSGLVGETVSVAVSKVIQTAAGRMIFAKIRE